jgi:hypothetical protein
VSVVEDLGAFCGVECFCVESSELNHHRQTIVSLEPQPPISQL